MRNARFPETWSTGIAGIRTGSAPPDSTTGKGCPRLPSSHYPYSATGAAMAGGETSGDTVVLVVVTWNSAGVLPGLLDSLRPGMAGLDWQLVIADNDSRDGTVELVRDRTPSAIVLQTGRNAG